MKLKEITDIENTIQFLESKGVNHKNYYHYTTWDSVEKIINGKSFLLTRGNSMRINDQHEAIMKGAYTEWNKTYIASFSFGSSENMAMWGLYGLPWEDAVRIAIPKEQMILWLNSLKNIKIWEKGISKEEVTTFDAKLNDVLYVNGKKGDNFFNLSHRDDHFTVRNQDKFYRFDEDPRMTGYVKNYAWSYEKEVRLKIKLPYDYYSEKIQVDIPEETINSMTITTGPNFRISGNQLLSKLRAENRVFSSGFENLVKYRSICEICKHENFERKENE